MTSEHATSRNRSHSRTGNETLCSDFFHLLGPGTGTGEIGKNSSVFHKLGKIVNLNSEEIW